MRKLKLFLDAKAANTPPRGISKASRVIFSVLTLLFLSIGQVWADDPAAQGATLFSEDFSSYSATDVPSGTVTTTTGRVVYGNANVTYACTNGESGSATAIYAEAVATGTSPEIMIGKYGSGGSTGGSFSVTGIPSGGAQEITVSFKQNKQKLKVAVAGTGYTSDGVDAKPANAGTVSFDITVGDGAASTFDLTFSVYSSNVRVDDILVTVKTAGEGGAAAPTLTGVTVSGTPTKTSYYAGDNFDPAGLTVTGTYSDESTAPITSGITWSYDPSQELALNQTSIGVTATVDEIPSPKYNVTGLSVTAPVVSNWQVTAPADLETGDVVVLTMNVGGTYYAAANNNGTSSAPTATNIAVTGSNLSAIPATTLQWTVTVSDDTYQFAVGDNNLYCTSTNNGVRVGTNDNKVFTVATNEGEYGNDYLLNSGTSRYLGVYFENSVAKDWRCYTSVNNNIKSGSLVIFREPASSKEAAGLAFETAAYLVKANGSLATPSLTNPNSLSVSYASSDEAVAEVAADGSITIKAAGKAVITASSEETDTYKAGSASYTIYVAEQAGTEEDPLTVASTKTLIDLGCTTLNVYVAGKVSAISTAYNSQYGNISFDISADGATTGDQVRAFRCVATAQTSVENVDLLADVVVSGTLTKYGSTYELAEGCKLESYTAPETPKTDISNDIEHPYTVAVADGLIEDPNSDLSKTVFVKGVVTGFATNKVTIRDTKNGEEYIELYKHTLGENISELLEDEIVIVTGTMQKYNNTTYQMNQGCQVVWKKSVTLVKFLAPVDWENVYAYTFTWDEVNGATEYDGAWPGKQLTKDGDWYAVNVPVDAKVIFHNNLGGDANQTVDIVADESKCYIWKGFDEYGKMDVLAVEGCEMKYYIAGSEALTGQDWQHIALNEGNTITFSNVAAGDHQFKITNGTWDWNIGRTYASATGVTLWTEGDNVGFTIAEGKVMNITITYNPATEQISVAAEEVVAQAWSTVKFMAAGSDFATKENVPQGQAYTIDLAETPWRPGYNFAGWSADEIAEASEFTTPLTTITPDADEVTLYAVFSKEITPGSTTYNKVTSAPADWSGEYLLVYEDGTTAYAWDGTDNANNGKTATISDNKIAKPEGAALLTVATVSGGYTIQIDGDKYIKDNGSGSNIRFAENESEIATAVITIEEEGNWAKIMFSQRCIRFNNQSGNSGMRFRNYAATSQQPVQLYKKVATPGTYSYTTDPATIYHIAGTPALTGEGTAEAWAHVALGEGNTITFDNVGAGEYKFKITDGTWSWSKGDAAVDKTNSSGVTFSETDGDGNVVFSVASETSVTITYDAANDKILVVAPRDYHIAGSEALTGQDWQHIALNEGNTITFNNVAAGDYEFKITDGTWDWYVSYAAENVDSENSNVTISESELNNNFKFTLAAKSNVTIAYNEETGKVTVNSEAIPEPKNVVILAEYNSKFYAMTNSLTSGALAGVEVEKDGSKIVVSSAEDKADIQWTATVDGDNTTLKDGDDYYIKGSSGASLSLEADPYNWNWDGEKSCYISSAYTNRGLFFSNSGNVFKGYALSNITSDGYAATEVIEIDPEDIVISSKVDPALAYTPASDEITVGDAWSAPVLGYVEGFDGLAAITYESSNEAVATVTDAGVIALAGGTGTATITATFAGNASYHAGSATYTVKVNEPADVCDGTDDFLDTEDKSSPTSYSDRSTPNGWTAVNAGYKLIDEKAYWMINGKTTAVGVITSPELTGGLGSLKFRYANTNSESNGVSVKIEIKQGEDVVKEYTLTKPNSEVIQNTVYTELIEDINVAGTFQIVITNLSPSNNTGNKDRVSIGRFCWSSYDGPTDFGSYQRDVTNGNYGTICLPKAGVISGATLFRIADYANNMIYIEEVGNEMEAGKPYIFQATSNQLNVVYSSAATEDAGDANGLHGFYDLTGEQHVLTLLQDAGNYILYSNQYWLVSGRDAYIEEYRAYIKIAEINFTAPAPGRRRVAMNVNGTNQATGFENIEASEKPVKLMLNGQMYILRGEKMYDATGRLVK